MTDHEGHTNAPLEHAGNERKLKVKSVITSLKEDMQKQSNKVAEIDKTCAQIKEKAAKVEEEAKTFVEALICVMRAKKQEICNEVENHAAESILHLVAHKNKLEDNAKMSETVNKQTETLFKRSTSCDIVQFDKSVDAIFQEGALNEEEEERDNCASVALRRFIFVGNETLIEKMNSEGIGALKT